MSVDKGAEQPALSCDECGQSNIPLRLSVHTWYCQKCWSDWTNLVNSAMSAVATNTAFAVEDASTGAAAPALVQTDVARAYDVSWPMTPTVDTSDMLQFMKDQHLPCSGEFHANYDGSFTPIEYIFTSDSKARLVVRHDPDNIDFGTLPVYTDTALVHDDTDQHDVFEDALNGSPEIMVDLFGPSPPVIPCSAKSYARMA